MLGKKKRPIPPTSPKGEKSKYTPTTQDNNVIAQGTAYRQGVKSTKFFLWNVHVSSLGYK